MVLDWYVLAWGPHAALAGPVFGSLRAPNNQ